MQKTLNYVTIFRLEIIKVTSCYEVVVTLQVFVLVAIETYLTLVAPGV